MSDLVTLERQVYLRRPEAAATAAQVMLAMATSTLALDKARDPKPAELTLPVLTRIAAALCTAAVDPALPVRREDFVRLAVVHGALANTLVASGFGSADHALALIGLPSARSATLSKPELERYLRFFSLYTLDADVAPDIAQVLAGPPDLALLNFLKLIAVKPIATLHGHVQRDALLDLQDSIQPGQLPATPDHVVLLSNAWMLVSYAEHPRKHQVKRKLNPVMRDVMGRMGVKDAPSLVRRPDRTPTVVVASEIMHSNHVQYRYFGQYLRQLKSRFHSVLVTDRREVDDHVRDLFHEVRDFERRTDGSHLKTAAGLIRETDPDVLYYPSVGMRHWGVALANLRLAPVQVMGLGHTASSYCETVDYCVAEAGLVSGPEVWHETMVLIPDEAHILERSPHYVPVEPQIREKPATLRIALPSNLLKINPRFLQFLAELRAATRRPIDFHLFPNVSGVELAAARAVVAKALPGATVHPILAYNRYLALLNQCDINLSPFPFGGMHSVIDSIRQGLPVVALEGRESHNRTDAMLLRRFGMPDWLICHSEDDYRHQALRLIDDDALRVEVSRQAAGCGVDRLIYGNATTPLRTEFADAIDWIHGNHEAIKADGRPIWTLEDRMAFMPPLVA